MSSSADGSTWSNWDQHAERQRIEQPKQAAERIVVTTTNHIEGCHVVKHIGVESVEFVIGTGLFSEITTEIFDFFGNRSRAFEVSSPRIDVSFRKVQLPRKAREKAQNRGSLE